MKTYSKDKICIMTSQHPAMDVRIFQKEILSLSKSYKNIYLIAKKTANMDSVSGIHTIWVNNKPGLLNRMLRNIEIFFNAIKINARVYHFHDPDLIFVAFLLKILFRKKIIYDIHEYFVDMISHRTYLHKWQSLLFSKLYTYSEKIIIRWFDLLILAEEKYKKFYDNYRDVIVIQNFVKKENILEDGFISPSKQHLDIVALGGITEKRGIWEALDLVRLLNTRIPTTFHLMGSYESPELEIRVDRRVKEYGLLNKFKYYGYVENKKAIKLIRNFDIGIFLLHPIINYTTALPTKLFEYMGNGLAVICCDFENLVDMNKKINFGLTIDIFNLEKESNRIFEFVLNSDEMKKIRKKNIETIKNNFLWEFEEGKLLNAYERLLHT